MKEIFNLALYIWGIQAVRKTVKMYDVRRKM